MNLKQEEEKSIQEFATFLLSLTPNEFALVAMTFGLILSQPLDEYSQQSAGNFFVLLGQAMITISAQNFTKNSRK